ncbi:hypothetical protein RSOLAG1IB_06285 [Rhizoctonia solani AG-1 IB]|uniref:CHAT domain-containing protein n=1 Tax=Thanatephorus cucumeris (strain AG1-IB / isolate 7/3/14) TaxID=1108050 RepID=A0A0B7FAR2_THACB|nr:hypothetical protein RSOLAG1IB_06285 [Rhizoctonia solani AG-1 IB]
MWEVTPLTIIIKGEIAGPSALSDALSPAPELGAPTDHTTTYHIKRQLNEDTSDVRSIEHEEQEDVLLVFFNATTSTFDFLHNFGISKSIIKLFTNFQSIAASEDMAKEYAFVSLSAQESATHSGCDALVILPEQGNISHILLPNFDKQKAQHIRFEMGKYLRNKRMKVGRIERHAAVQEQGEEFEIVLAALWHDVVKPILDHLGYTKRISSNDLPHIAWCPTGALSFLPLHAAGDYDQPGSRVFDYVISSYTPNINAFLTPKPSTLSPESRMLAVGQANTLGQSSLPGTSIELDFIKAHSQGKVQYTQLTDAQATVTAVLDAMEYHDWVHLACYAHQDTQDPTQNGFFLHDGTLDLASINRRSPTSKGLAFLSACETAPGDEIPPDEAIHLASGMLMAGYSSVIGTMWPVVDEDAPFVADKVYGQLMQDGKVGNGEAGKALHSAVAALRERVGEKSFGRWMPYIHIGS